MSGKLTSRIWYGVALGLIVPGIATTVLGFTQLAEAVEGLQRVVMPGKAEIVLPAGPTTLYGERRSLVGGKAYQNEELSFQCRALDPRGGAVRLAPAASRVSYSVGDYAGSSDIDLDIPAAGMYVVECEAPAPFVLAIGQGVGAWIVVSIIGAIPIGLGVLMALIVLIKRSRQKRRAARDART
jgi:hypothetical protein